MIRLHYFVLPSCPYKTCISCENILPMYSIHIKPILAFVHLLATGKDWEILWGYVKYLFEHITLSFCFIRKYYITCTPQNSSSRQTLYKLDAVNYFDFTLLWEVHFLVGCVSFSSGLNYTNKHTIIAYFAPGQFRRK